MNTKINRIARDIEKIQTRITADQARLRELKRQKTELEDIEIVNQFRAIDVAPGELAAMIASYRNAGTITAPAMEDSDD